MGYPKGRPRGSQSPEHIAKRCSTPSARANKSVAGRRTRNIPEVFQLMQQYDYPLIDKLRQTYCNLDSRCNNPNDCTYKYYGGRDIKNLFTSQFDFFNYVINVLGYNTFESIDGLWIDRIDNDGNYEPGNIRFVTPKVSNKNTRRSSL